MADREIIDLVLMGFVCVTAVSVIAVNSLLASTILMAVYSLLMAIVWSNLHALDVGFTESAVGAGISTILLLGAIVWTGREEKRHPVDLRGLAVCLVAGALLVFSSFDLPRFGDPKAPLHTLRTPKYLSQTVGKLPGAPSAQFAKTHHQAHHPHILPADDFDGHVPNTVTALLAAYRGYDTMFETTVIFTAGISVVLLLRIRRRKDGTIIGHESEQESETTGPEGYRA